MLIHSVSEPGQSAAQGEMEMEENWELFPTVR